MPVKDKTMFDNLPFVKDPLLITVKTIKKKHLESMPKMAKNESLPDDYQIVGIAEECWIIILIGEHLFRVHHLNWIDKMVMFKQRNGQKISYEENQAEYDKLRWYPQLFVE